MYTRPTYHLQRFHSSRNIPGVFSGSRPGIDLIHRNVIIWFSVNYISISILEKSWSTNIFPRKCNDRNGNGNEPTLPQNGNNCFQCVLINRNSFKLQVQGWKAISMARRDFITHFVSRSGESNDLHAISITQRCRQLYVRIAKRHPQDWAFHGIECSR